MRVYSASVRWSFKNHHQLVRKCFFFQHTVSHPSGSSWSLGLVWWVENLTGTSASPHISRMRDERQGGEEKVTLLHSSRVFRVAAGHFEGKGGFGWKWDPLRAGYLNSSAAEPDSNPSQRLPVRSSSAFTQEKASAIATSSPQTYSIFCALHWNSYL